jgi:hypothetical protein
MDPGIRNNLGIRIKNSVLDLILLCRLDCIKESFWAQRQLLRARGVPYYGPGTRFLLAFAAYNRSNTVLLPRIQRESSHHTCYPSLHLPSLPPFARTRGWVNLHNMM